MHRLLIVALILLSGCSREAERAEQEYEIVNSSIASTASEKCEAASHAADAWLKARDESEYLEWKARAATDCSRAKYSLY